MSSSPRILCISGPNLQLLGTREPEIYGSQTLDDIHRALAARASQLGATVDAKQTNHEGTIVDWIGDARDDGFEGLLLNPGAYTHTSIAIHDAIKAVALPAVEVHLSNLDTREEFRRQSRIAAACVGRVSGFGGASYVLGLEGLVAHLKAHLTRT